MLAAFAAAGALVLSACGTSGGYSAGGGTGSPGPAQQATTGAPAATTWRLGGAWTGPFPPAVWPMPGPLHTVALPNYTTTAQNSLSLAPGYKYRGSVAFGVPLHYGIPQQGLDCSLGQDGTRDLPPGQYVVPFAVTIGNLLNQQAPAPGVITGASVQITGYAGSSLSWSDGSCGGWTLNAHGQNTLYGLIGPATAAQLQQATVSIGWFLPANVPPMGISKPLAVLVPGRALPGS